VLLVLRDQQDLKVYLEHLLDKGLLVQQAILVVLVQLVQLDLLAQLEPQVLLAQQVFLVDLLIQEQQAWRVQRAIQE